MSVSGPVRRWGAVALLAIVGAAATWVSFVSTFANVSVRAAPERAVAWWSRSAAGWSQLSAIDLQRNQGASARLKATAAGRRALALAPLDARTIGTLGIVAALDGDGPRAWRLFAASERLSRREVSTQLAMIEQAVGRGDIRTAMVHYDRALRTSMAVRATLFPILIAAGSDLAIATALGDTLAGAPQWRIDFLPRYIDAVKSPRALLTVAQRIGMDRLPRADPLRQATIDRLVALGAIDTAARLSASAPPSGVHNSGFDVRVTTPPFDWVLALDGDVTGDIGLAAGGGTLRISSNGAAGIAARQLVRVVSGRQRLSFRITAAEEESADDVVVTLTCGGREISRLAVPARAGAVTGRFMVPVACRWVWLELGLGGNPDSVGEQVELDDVRIAPDR